MNGFRTLEARIPFHALQARGRAGFLLLCQALLHSFWSIRGLFEPRQERRHGHVRSSPPDGSLPEKGAIALDKVLPRCYVVLTQMLLSCCKLLRSRIGRISRSSHFLYACQVSPHFCHKLARTGRSSLIHCQHPSITIHQL